MQTGEDTQGLRKIIDFTRLISLFILSIHFYISCYLAFQAWGCTAEITNRIVMNIAKTGLFTGMAKPKLASLLFLMISLIGIKGKKDEKMDYRTITAYLVTGIILYFISVLCFYLHTSVSIIAISYMIVSASGYLLVLTGGTYLSRLLKDMEKTE